MSDENNIETNPENNSKNSGENTLAIGREIIRKFVENLPHCAGVYRMLDTGGNPLYIGKAKSLKNRVSNYVNAAALNTRLQRMISLTKSMEFTPTRSEAEALLLEANLIKKFSPRYNVLLKDDKTFPYIFFSGEHDFPRISKYRGARAERGKYFGPFVSAGAVDEAITTLQKAFRLRPCTDNIFKNRTRPCLQYQIKRCSAPCVDYISKADYTELTRQAQDFLKGKSRQIQDELLKEMQSASEQMDYEKASVLRDRIKSLTQVQQQSKLSAAGLEDADIIALVRDAGEACVQIITFRAGQNYGSKNYFPSNTKDLSDGEILSSFIAQFYSGQPAPKLILVSAELEDRELLEEALETHINQPQRGEKHDLITQATASARDALMRHIAGGISQKAALLGVKELFNLPEIPKRIEVYDNSHIQGTNQVGVMIVAGVDGFIKGQYRKFDIGKHSSPNRGEAGRGAATQNEKKSHHNHISPHPNPPPNGEGIGGDDYAMLREVFTRRFKRLKDEPENTPDLVLIDGGLGQVSSAKQVFDELQISHIKYVGIAKGVDRNAGREWFFIDGKTPFQLPENDPTLYYLQRLRDEAHRFAIGAHRDKRSKTMQVSELDLITGIGASRKKALLHHFGSARAVAAASISEIGQVAGISQAVAKKIYQHFHGSFIATS